MSRLHKTVQALAHTAGWKTPIPDAEQKYTILFEHDVDITFFSPNDELCIMQASIQKLPEQKHQAEDVLAAYAAQALGKARTKQSIITVEDSNLILYDSVHLIQDNMHDITLRVRDFLNDIAWWRSHTAGPQSATTPAAPSGMFVPGIGWVPVR